MAHEESNLDVRKPTPADLFRAPAAVVYELPCYQRAYVWEQNQWQNLWEDIKAQAARWSLEKERDDALPDTHFMGALVLQRITRASSGTQRHAVVDGQQRLITAQILLAAIKSVLQQKSHKEKTGKEIENVIERIKKLIENEEIDINRNTERYKVSPSQVVDRKAFIRVITDKLSSSRKKHPLEEAYCWFCKQIQEYLSGDSDIDPNSKAKALEWAATFGIRFVEINIAGDSDANKIFNSLNSHGTPLLAADQAKNFIYWKIRKEEKKSKIEAENRIKEIWPFDESGNRNSEDENLNWWLQKHQAGRLGVRIDAFLYHWLILHSAQKVKIRDVMDKFREHINNYDRLGDVGEDLRRNSEFYKEILGYEAKQNSFLFRWQHAIQVTPMLPVLLKLRQSTNQEREKAEQYLESYGMRRVICNLNKAGQNNMMATLSQRLNKSKPENASKVLFDFLICQEERSRIWPSDQDVRDTLAEEPVTRNRNTRKAKIILLAIEQHMQPSMSEKSNLDMDKLQIEHLWPQSWKENWPEPSSHKLLDQIGNLTLVSDKLNPAMSNSEWNKKRDALKEHSMLKLNEELLKHQGPWNEAAIQDRNQKLAEIIVEIWPRPGA